MHSRLDYASVLIMEKRFDEAEKLLRSVAGDYPKNKSAQSLLEQLDRARRG